MHTYAAVFTPKDGAGTGFGNHVAPLDVEEADAGLASEAAERYGDALFARWREFYDLTLLPVVETQDGVDPFRGVPAADERKLSTQFLVAALIALRPFAEFKKMWDEKTLRGADRTLYAIHTGTRWAAELTHEDLRRARAWVEAAETAGIGK